MRTTNQRYYYPLWKMKTSPKSKNLTDIIGETWGIRPSQILLMRVQVAINFMESNLVTSI